jgi:Ca2+-binding RTX toxin-like protein
MAKKYTYQFTPLGESGYIQLTQSTVTGAQSSQTILTSLFANGVEKSPFGDISGFQYVNGQIPAGDSNNPADPDILSLDSGSLRNALVWDEHTTSFGLITPYNYYQPGNLGQHTFVYTDADGRYGLPGGGTDQTTAIDVIKLGQGSEYNASVNTINLGYDVANGGIAYNTSITIIGGPGRELLIGGEAADVLYGGDDHSGIGEGIWGGAGGDTIYGGANTGQSITPGGPGDSGSDDLYGYAGNDIIYGGNDGDVYYGDSGDDNIYGHGSTGVATAGSGYNGDFVTFFGGDGNDTMFASVGIQTTREFFFGGNPDGVGAGNLWRDRAFNENPNNQDTGTLDVVSYVNSTRAITVNLNGSVAYNEGPEGQAITNGSLMGTGAGGAVGDVFFGIEGVVGGTLGDTLFGNAVGNFFSGLGATDTLYGAAGNDTLWGGANDDTLYGGLNADIVFGDDGNDYIQADQDQVLAGGSTSNAWDGTAGSAPIVLSMAGKGHTQDTTNGGIGTDTYNFSVNGTGGGATGASALGFSNTTQRIFGIELLIGSAAADIVNLTFNDGVTRLAYTDNVTIFAGDSTDIVFSGSGSDLIVGDSTTGGVGTDTLFGGSGIDTIFGDVQDPLTTFGAADTLYGGEGNDTVFGGAGNDRITDADSTARTSDSSINGGDGADFITADFTNNTAIGRIDGGANSGSDSADVIFTTGNYNFVVSNLGLGNDVFIGSDAVGATLNGDTVSGQDGNDAIASYIGNDLLNGDAGNDVLWGGAGVDTIYGGANADNLYPGPGNNDLAYGGANVDVYYWARTDGSGDQIWDEGRILHNSSVFENYLVIQPSFNSADVTLAGQSAPDWLNNAEGVFEVDKLLTDNAGGNDMVQLVEADIPGNTHLWTLNVVSGAGTGSNVTFDDRDINQIVLWNSNPGSGNTLQIYQFFAADGGTHPTDGYYFLS